ASNRRRSCRGITRDRRPRPASSSPLRGRAWRPGIRLQGGARLMWNKVAIVGAGLIKFGELFDQSYEQMAAGALTATLASVDKGIDKGALDAMVLATQRGTLWGQEGIGGNTVPQAVGLNGIACTRVENACPSGSDAIRIGSMMVASGVHDIVCVIGVEKMRD